MPAFRHLDRVLGEGCVLENHMHWMLIRWWQVCHELLSQDHTQCHRQIIGLTNFRVIWIRSYYFVFYFWSWSACQTKQNFTYSFHEKWAVSNVRWKRIFWRIWTLFSSHRLLFWFGTVLKEWFIYFDRFYTLNFFFPVIFLFQSVLSFLSFPQALLLNLKVVNNILAISGSLIKMVLILTVTRIKISLSHRFLSLILQPQKQRTVIRKDMTA